MLDSPLTILIDATCQTWLPNFKAQFFGVDVDSDVSAFKLNPGSIAHYILVEDFFRT
jgi:hypothetical protein